MATSYRCPRCGVWHDATVDCNVDLALRHYLTVDPACQRAGDHAEEDALARIRAWRQGAAAPRREGGD
jgi:hypothetical protein